MTTTLRYLLLQVRNPGDPMSGHEVRCFARHLRCLESDIRVGDLISDPPGQAELDEVDVVLLGGSGDFSVVEGGPWLESALNVMRQLHELSKPTFASCWGFQAFSLALGGEVVTDLERAEVGTFDLTLTDEGQADPVFGPMGSPFAAQLGHQDIVDRLPEGAICLARSDRVGNQGFRFEGKPIYGSQFHPELDLSSLLDRLRTYPGYIKSITGLEYEAFVRERCRESIATEGMLERFVLEVLKTLNSG